MSGCGPSVKSSDSQGKRPPACTGFLLGCYSAPLPTRSPTTSHPIHTTNTNPLPPPVPTSRYLLPVQRFRLAEGAEPAAGQQVEVDQHKIRWVIGPPLRRPPLVLDQHGEAGQVGEESTPSLPPSLP